MKMAIYYLLILVLPAIVLVCLNCVYSLKYCQKGSYEFPVKNDRPVCLLCREGTFMPHHDHRYKECFKCTEVVDPSLEILVTPCNDTQDAVIHCIPGYYRRLGRNPREKARCEKCTECDHPIIPCQTYEDTHCCQGDHYIVFPDRNGIPVCWETRWFCRQGHYFHVVSYLCKPCPTGTFMSLDYHSRTECWPCQTPSERHHLPKHATIIHECNSTHPPIIGCEDGFYTDHKLDYHKGNIGCSPCTLCNPADGIYEGRACDQFHNTICCPQPDMIVVDTPGGMKCEADSKPVFSTEADSDYHQTDDTSTTSSRNHETPDGSCGECRCESPSCHTNSVIGVTVTVTFLAVTFLGIIAVFLFCRQRLFKIIRRLFNVSLHDVQNVDEYAGGEAGHLLSYTEDNSENNMFQEGTLEKIGSYLEELKLSNSKCEGIMKLLENEMSRGFRRNPNALADVITFPTIKTLPNGPGEFMVLDLGGAKVRILFLQLQGKDMDIVRRKTYLIPTEVKTGTGDQLIDFIADCTHDFISHLTLIHDQVALGCAVSFPCQRDHNSLDKARLIKWTNGFKCDDLIGQDICELLEKAFDKRGNCKVKTVAVVHNSVSTLMSVAHGDLECLIGMVLGTGYNVCYVEDPVKTETWNGDNAYHPQSKQVVVSTEWGSLGDNGNLDFFRTEYDREVDDYSDNPGHQRMEKMISGMYLGEIVRVVLERLSREGLLFKDLFKHGIYDCHLLKKGSFLTKNICEIESDPDDFYQSTKRVLNDLQLEGCTKEDTDTVRLVCTLISERAAFLAAAALATLVNRLNKPSVTIAVDGSLYRYHRRMQQLLEQKIKELIKPGLHFKLQEAEGGSAIGAALTAAMSLNDINIAAKQDASSEHFISSSNV